MIRLAVAGAMGRMGRCALDVAASDPRFTVIAALSKPGCPSLNETIRTAGREFHVTERLDAACDVVIDFTVADGTMHWLNVCLERGTPLVTGVTGHDTNQLARIREASTTLPVLMAANFSIGIQAMLKVAVDLARQLGDGYDVEIVETHHRHKVDAPSGTAVALAEAVAAARGWKLSEHLVFGRAGWTGERPVGQIAIHAVRMGELISRHQIHFSGPAETISIDHAVHCRDTYAQGALRAAAWIVGRAPGFYTMRDVLG